MSGEQTVSELYPPPPVFYLNYTDENIKLREEALKSASSATLAATIQQQDFSFLDPPKPLTTGTFTVFGMTKPITEEIQLLKNYQIPQLYPDEVEGTEEYIKILKKLNHSLLFNYVELLKTLSRAPEDFRTNIDNIRLILINMHHILNGCRTHQARDTIKLMLEQQINRRMKSITEINQCKEKVELICNSITKETLVETLNNSIKELEIDEAMLKQMSQDISEINSSENSSDYNEFIKCYSNITETIKSPLPPKSKTSSSISNIPKKIINESFDPETTFLSEIENMLLTG
ncbi:MED7-domain-containing protein [Anaeromyces robustus]|uniref:Mediator of RNA polymerase II transcription subunit 7 n=1 Tax=Anaeromyces robustus TaxID=1754192 RepID=A0A1Y1WYS0_9FUNG|nr:MED7-domain-containing protein [Anaeromyces robustus]|eukprot:ORX78719.1 MED7-domain-containing protein [Anaeromyces robustus]